MTTMTTTSNSVTTTKLDPTAGEPSTGSVETSVANSDDSLLSASVDVQVFAHSDADAQTLWVDLRQISYARLGGFSDEPLMSFVTLLGHRFSRAEAEMLVTVLNYELAKL